jgi:hypothetical protein
VARGVYQICWVQCDGCGRRDEVEDMTHFDPKWATKQWRSSGWVLGKEKDTCPNCGKKRRG